MKTAQPNKRRRPRGHRKDPASNPGDPGKFSVAAVAHGYVPTAQRRPARVGPSGRHVARWRQW